MARNRGLQKYRGGHHKKQFTLPLAVIAGFAPLAVDVGTQIKNGDWAQAGKVLVHNTIGYDGFNHNWNLSGFSHGLFPIIAGILVHKFVGGRLGVNRMLANAGIPVVRL